MCKTLIILSKFYICTHSETIFTIKKYTHPCKVSSCPFAKFPHVHLQALPPASLHSIPCYLKATADLLFANKHSFPFPRILQKTNAMCTLLSGLSLSLILLRFIHTVAGINS